MKYFFVFLFVLFVNDIKISIGSFKNYFKEGYMFLIIILHNFFGIFYEKVEDLFWLQDSLKFVVNKCTLLTQQCYVFNPVNSPFLGTLSWESLAPVHMVDSEWGLIAIYNFFWACPASKMSLHFHDGLVVVLYKFF